MNKKIYVQGTGPLQISLLNCFPRVTNYICKDALYTPKIQERPNLTIILCS
jgi:hypothetical protein